MANPALPTTLGRGRRPLPPPKQQPSPSPSPTRDIPASPRKRRALLQNTDENKGEMSIEDHIYRTDAFRSTSNKTKLPLGVEEQLPSDQYLKLHEDREIQNLVHSVLRQYGIDLITFQFLDVNKHGYGKAGDAKVITLVIKVSWDNKNVNPPFSRARKHIRADLQATKDEALWEVEVEITDAKRAYNPVLRPILPKDPHLGPYNLISRSIAAYLKEALGSDWVGMSIFETQHNRHITKTQFQIVIFVRPFSHRNWEDLRTQIRGRFIFSVQDSRAKDLDVVFLPGTCRTTNDENDAEVRGRSVAADLKPWPERGSSTGVKDEGGGGTLGGFFMIKKDGKPPNFGFLTCSHVVSPGEGTTKTEVLNNFKVNGISLNDEQDPARTTMQYPAHTDMICTKKAGQEKLNALEGPDGLLEKLLGELTFRKEIGQKTGFVEGQIENSMNEKDQFKRLLSLCDDLPLTLGQTAFATGEAIAVCKSIYQSVSPGEVVQEKESILDFAFVHLHARNKAKFRDSGPGKLQPLENCGLRGWIPYYTPAEITPLPTATARTHLRQELGDFEPGRWYYKKGRTTGYTEGVCHGAEFYVNLEKERSFYNDAGEFMGRKEPSFTAEQIVCNAPHGYASRQEFIIDFCDEGDSGALLIDESSQVCGLLLGYVVGQCGESGGNGAKGRIYGTKAGLVTPMSVIANHLKLREGGAMLELVTHAEMASSRTFARTDAMEEEE